ncbi:MAG: hypothetical protein P3W93_003740 [Thermus sp.]|nr:hypothetical protein [Thermus sp.]
MGKKKEQYAVYVVKGKEAGGEYETVDEGKGPWEWAWGVWIGSNPLIRVSFLQ